MMRHWRLIIFDMDGVLLPSIDVHVKAYQDTMRHYELSLNYKKYIGMATDMAIRKILSDSAVYESEAKIEELIAAKRQKTDELLQSPIAVPGAKTVLRLLSHQSTLALASSAYQSRIEKFLRYNEFGYYFSYVVNAAHLPSKPAPDIYLKVCNELKVAPENALVVEDSIPGVQAGKAAGCIVCGVIGTQTGEELMLVGADYTINNLVEILN